MPLIAGHLSLSCAANCPRLSPALLPFRLQATNLMTATHQEHGLLVSFDLSWQRILTASGGCPYSSYQLWARTTRGANSDDWLWIGAAFTERYWVILQQVPTGMQVCRAPHHVLENASFLPITNGDANFSVEVAVQPVLSDLGTVAASVAECSHLIVTVSFAKQLA